MSHFDELGTSVKEVEYKPTSYEILIHQVFSQSAAGKELLEIWEKDLIHSRVIDPFETNQLKVGFDAGRRQERVNILNTIEKINTGGK